MNSAGDGGFVTQDCYGMFETGEVPFALVGNWRLGSFGEVEYGVAAFPGAGGDPGRPWLTSSVVVMSLQAQARGRGEGAQALLEWFGSRDGQLQMGTAAQRLPARSDAIEAIEASGGVFSPEIVALVAMGRPQVNDELLRPGAGNGWFGALTTLFPEQGALTPAEIPGVARAVRETLIEKVARER
jgi:ABC-type glycerol-3-phosphate transport system substrate-binding protein